MFRIPLSLTIVASCFLAACGGSSNTPPPAQPAVASPETASAAKAAGAPALTLNFDGGYAYVAKAGALDVGSIGAGEPHDHPLKIGVNSADNYDAAATTIKPVMIDDYYTWDLTGYDVEIRPDGTPVSGGVTMPAAQPAPETCAELVDDAPDANQLGYIPNLTALHPGTAVDMSKFGAKLALTAGEFKVRRVGLCWALKKGNNEGKPTSLAKGLLGMRYTLPGSASYVDLRLTQRNGTGTQTIRLKATAAEGLTARVSSHFTQPMIRAKDGDADVHFRRFYELLASKSTIQTGERFDAILKSKEMIVSPGNDCLSAFFTQ
jgi:hypothetical protein